MTLEEITKKLQDLQEKSGALNAVLRKLNGEPEVGPLPRAGGGSVFGPLSSHIVPNTPNAGLYSRGTDSVAAVLTPGEMVVNSASTSANRELLEKINSSRGPVHLASGGLVGGPAYLELGGDTRNLARFRGPEVEKAYYQFLASGASPERALELATKNPAKVGNLVGPLADAEQQAINAARAAAELKGATPPPLPTAPVSPPPTPSANVPGADKFAAYKEALNKGASHAEALTESGILKPPPTPPAAVPPPLPPPIPRPPGALVKASDAIGKGAFLYGQDAATLAKNFLFGAGEESLLQGGLGAAGRQGLAGLKGALNVGANVGADALGLAGSIGYEALMGTPQTDLLTEQGNRRSVANYQAIGARSFLGGALIGAGSDKTANKVAEYTPASSLLLGKQVAKESTSGIIAAHAVAAVEAPTIAAIKGVESLVASATGTLTSSEEKENYRVKQEGFRKIASQQALARNERLNRAIETVKEKTGRAEELLDEFAGKLQKPRGGAYNLAIGEVDNAPFSWFQPVSFEETAGGGPRPDLDSGNERLYSLPEWAKLKTIKQAESALSLLVDYRGALEDARGSEDKDLQKTAVDALDDTRSFIRQSGAIEALQKVKDAQTLGKAATADFERGYESRYLSLFSGTAIKDGGVEARVTDFIAKFGKEKFALSGLELERERSRDPRPDSPAPLLDLINSLREIQVNKLAAETGELPPGWKEILENFRGPTAPEDVGLATDTTATLPTAREVLPAPTAESVEAAEVPAASGFYSGVTVGGGLARRTRPLTGLSGTRPVAPTRELKGPDEKDYIFIGGHAVRRRPGAGPLSGNTTPSPARELKGPSEDDYIFIGGHAVRRRKAEGEFTDDELEALYGFSRGGIVPVYRAFGGAIGGLNRKLLRGGTSAGGPDDEASDGDYTSSLLREARQNPGGGSALLTAKYGLDRLHPYLPDNEIIDQFLDGNPEYALVPRDIARQLVLSDPSFQAILERERDKFGGTDLSNQRVAQRAFGAGADNLLTRQLLSNSRELLPGSLGLLGVGAPGQREQAQIGVQSLGRLLELNTKASVGNTGLEKVRQLQLEDERRRQFIGLGLPLFQAGFNGAGRPVPKLASGGVIGGNPALGDVYPAFLSAGEVVLSQHAVSRMGGPQVAQRFNTGGVVGRPQYLAGGGDASWGTLSAATATSGGSPFNAEGLTQALTAFSSSVQSFVQNGGLSEFSHALTAFSSNIDPLVKAMTSFPSRITVEGTQQVNVNINGAEALATLQEGLKDYVSKAVTAKLQEVISRSFPDSAVRVD